MDALFRLNHCRDDDTAGVLLQSNSTGNTYDLMENLIKLFVKTFCVLIIVYGPTFMEGFFVKNNGQITNVFFKKNQNFLGFFIENLWTGCP